MSTTCRRQSTNCRVAVLALLVLAATVRAAAERPANVTVELLAPVADVRAGTLLTVGLHFTMAENWSIYWRNPVLGQAPTVTWKLPAGFTAGDLQWPYPQRKLVRIPGYDGPPLVSYAYTHEATLLATITPPAELPVGEPVTIGADVAWVQCSLADGQCVPADATVELSLPVTAAAPTASTAAATIAAARDQLPQRDLPWTFAATADRDSVTLVGTPVGPRRDLDDIRFFPYEPNRVDDAADQPLTPAETGFALVVPLAAGVDPPKRLQGVLVAANGWDAAGHAPAAEIDVAVGDVALPAAPPPDAAPGAVGLGHLLGVILIAFLGGLLLNVMPCVLPVLGVKILDLVRQAGEERVPPWKHGLATSVGIVVSFWLMVAVLLILRSTGKQLGWGFQLQNPVFVFILVVVFFVFALSLFGVFEVGTGLIGLGSGLDAKRGLAGSFMSGILAAIVATPCTAPIMGPALAFALTRTAVVSLAIFTAMAVGLATPYMILTLFPALIRKLPRPGNWMVSLKQFMGFVLMVVVIYGLRVLAAQVGLPNLTRIMLALVLLGLGAWVLGRWAGPERSSRGRNSARAVSLLLALGGIVWGLDSSRSLPPEPAPPPVVAGDSSWIRYSHDGRIAWVKYSDDRLQALVDRGIPVFIDFTAEWCTQCHFNALAFGEDVARRFEQRGVVALEADWTRYDPAITAALARYDRVSVPLYVIHAPDGTVRVLPTKLTGRTIIDALDATLGPDPGAGNSAK